MKKIFTAFFFGLALISSAQDYQLFNGNSKKVFRTSDLLSESYSLTFDSTIINLAGTILYPYRKMEIEETSPVLCHPWGGECRARNSPVWIGRSVIQKSESDYTFITHSDDSLSFDFTLVANETHVFFEDESQRFSLSLVDNPTDTVHFAGLVDTVKRFQISHTDLDGNVINSPLSNYEIIIGKQLGLINFFRIDSFPQVLTPLQLLGNENPLAGISHLTNAMIYDHQPGDEIQYYKYYYYAQWPQLNSRQYIKHTFLERNDDGNLLSYLVKIESFYIDSATVSVDTTTLSYEKYEEIAILPFDFLETYGEYYFSDMIVQDHLGKLLWTYNTDDYRSLQFCEEDGLWCSTDDHDALSKSYVVGLGLYKTLYEYLPSYDYNGMEVVYYKKDGVEYGTEAIVGIKNLSMETRINILPNPTEDYFRIEGEFNNECKVFVNDLDGRTVLQIDNYSKNQHVNIGNLTRGIYLVNLIDSSNVYTVKLLIN